MTTEMRVDNKKNNRFLPVFLLLICVLAVCSCGRSDSKDRSIKIRISEEETKDKTKIQIPEFYSKNQEVSRNLKELDKKKKNLEKIVEKEKAKGSNMEMLSFVSDVKGYPQVTVVWYILEQTSRTYNIMTLAADEKNALPITSKEALQMTNMTGVDLSLKVGKLTKESGIRGELLSTEMQGFRIDEDGAVKEIYMKLILGIKKGEETTEEQHFFSYVLDEGKLVKLSERGFEVT